MSIILLFLAVLGGIAAWWLSRQRLASKPWLEGGVVGSFAGASTSVAPAARVAVGVFLGVVGSLFALLISAYSIRMRGTDWVSLPEMKLLWVNTGVLVLSSLALQSAAVSARRGRITDLMVGLAAGTAFALIFLAGQLGVWRELNAAGFLLASHPASAFFYLVTAIHGLHLLGGLAVLGRMVAVTWGPDGDAVKLRLSVELCAWYWHFLLLIWFVLFSILFLGAWSDWLYALCFGT